MDYSKKINEVNKKYNILWILVAIIIGFTLAYLLNYKSVKTGHKLQELILLTKGNCYHIHHFMVLSIIILAMLFGKYLNNDKALFIIIALLVGISLEDGLFKDWNVIKNNCHKKQLIKFIKNTTDVYKKYN
jgi:Na+/H+ antiporter NhaC